MRAIDAILNPELVDSARTSDTLAITAHDIGTIPRAARLHDAVLETRQRNAPGGPVDNCILGVSRVESTLIGLWLAGCLLDSSVDNAELQIASGERSLLLVIVDPTVRPDRLTMTPSVDLGQWLVEQSSGSRTLRVTLTGNDRGDTGRRLRFAGAAAEISQLAEFFLCFGHRRCVQNYEYVKGVDVPGLADRHSCELRVELRGARQSSGLRASTVP